MGWWTLSFRFVQIFYLLGVMSSIIIYTFLIFANRIKLEDEQLYLEYIEQYKELNGINSTPPYSQSEIVFASMMLKTIILAALPVTLLIYRSRLTTLQAFILLKLHQGGRNNVRGVAYNKCYQFLDVLFCLSRLRKLNYVEYIVFRNKNRGNREMWSENAQIIVLSVWFGLEFYYDDFEQFFIINYYLMLLLLLNF